MFDPYMYQGGQEGPNYVIKRSSDVIEVQSLIIRSIFTIYTEFGAITEYWSPIPLLGERCAFNTLGRPLMRMAAEEVCRVRGLTLD